MFHFEQLVYQIFTVGFLVIGTVTNIISAIVYSSKKLRKTSYSTYLFVLAVSDLSTTIAGNSRLLMMNYDFSWLPLPGQYLNAYNGFDIRELSLVSCRLHIFLTYYFTQLASTTLCFVNLDRVFGVVAGKSIKRRTARIMVLVAMVVLFVVNIHFLLFMGDFKDGGDGDSDSLPLQANQTIVGDVDFLLRLQSNQTVVNGHNVSVTNSRLDSHSRATKRCQEIKVGSYYHYFWTFYFYIDSTVYCIMPFLIMITSNCLIIGEIVKSRIKSNKVIIKRIRKTSRTRILENKSNAMLGSEKRLTFTLIAISLSFLLLTMPVFFVENLEAYEVVDFGDDFWLTLKALAYMLMYMNHIINFFFYCLLGPKFRREVKQIVLCLPYPDPAKLLYPLNNISKRNTSVHPSSVCGPVQSDLQQDKHLGFK